ncbi:MAG TPA: TonB-dependent receptor [Terriglobales bacterium]|nr:TonB-dependent receptor [Terriglobales bacterium]
MNRFFRLILVSLIGMGPVVGIPAQAQVAWNALLQDDAGQRIPGAIIQLHSPAGLTYTARTDDRGMFSFAAIAPGPYQVSATLKGKTFKAAVPALVRDGIPLRENLQLSLAWGELWLAPPAEDSARQASGGEHLSSGEVSSLPLNERDFSKLLLLAAGTMTDTNGAANFTQQFAVNGQRGSATVFALDGADTTDPEMGGATFSNFNVDAIQEVESSSGVMPAEIGHGGASYTNVVSKSGSDQVHGSVFEFIRNAAFDSRNFFDHKSIADEHRIPPFVRNEFGFTNGGPLVLPQIYDGRGRTYYFGEYQGFRQVLGTTQVFPVPTAAERQGIDTASFPGDTLTVPVNPAIAPALAGYPLPNDPEGAYGARTYAASSKVSTRTDQFSLRVDHRLSGKATLLARFSLNQVTGPITNPDQTAIDPSFGILFFDHQRNATLKYARTVSPHFTWETGLGYIRSTPFFPAGNHTQPGIGFGDGLFEGFDSPGGSIFGSFGNLYQFRHAMVYLHASHAFKWGVEIRFNRDATIFGTAPNGAYSFGGGTAYSPVFIPSASGQHDIQTGDPLPDSLTGLLTATPYSYSISAAADVTPIGDRFDEAAVRREAYNFYFQDAWKAAPNLTLSYGLRYEVNSRIHEAEQRTSLPVFLGPEGKTVPYWDRNAAQVYLYNPQPPYRQDWNGWGPRLAVDYGPGKHTMLHAGGAITTLLPNLWQDNFLTGSIPLLFNIFVSALPGAPVPFQNALTPVTLPQPYTTSGQLLFPTGKATGVAPNTPLDLARYQRDLTALTPGHQLQLLVLAGIADDFRNGYIGTYTLGVDHDFGDLKFTAAYVATTGIHLASVYSPNGYGGAGPGFAPFTQFDAMGNAISGFGMESIITSSSHSTYHSLQTGLSKNSARLGLGFQASYTYSKSLDDTSSVLGGLFGGAGTVLQTLPQDPFDPSAEKGPSTFDVAHVFAASVIQMLPLDHVSLLRGLGRPLTTGWQFLNVTTLMSGSPFSVYSGIQQTGAGAGGTDRPDLVEMPHFSTSRPVRQDYFGRGADNASFFNIPINVPGGTGPNQGRFGTLGRNTFRGPGFHDFDVALIKDTPFGRRGNREWGTVEFRAEFFNLFNMVNFGLPSNIVRGSGFGIISKTAGPSRQIQFSLKLIY